MDEKDKNHLKALHLRWTELHEEQAMLLREAMNYSASNSASLWRRFDSVIEEKSRVMEEIRALHHTNEE